MNLLNHKYVVKIVKMRDYKLISKLVMRVNGHLATSSMVKLVHW